MDKITRWIKVNTEFRGIHCWPECPYPDVAFLRNPHRHTFKVEVKVLIDHDDRDIEFFQFQHRLDQVISDWYFKGTQPGHKNIEPVDLGRKSCEQIAEDIFQVLRAYGYNRRMVICVSEDGEVGAELEFEPDGTKFEPNGGLDNEGIL